MSTITKNNKVIEVINQYCQLNSHDIIAIENYIKKYKVNLSELCNNNNFDILIYILNRDYRDDEDILKLVDIVLNQCDYPTLNYTQHYYTNDKRYCSSQVPLFSAIARNKFKVANLLQKREADINFVITNNKYHGMDILHFLTYYTDNYYYLNPKNLKYILYHNFNMKFITHDLLFKYVSDNKYELLKVIFDHYIFDSKFILKMLCLYNRKTTLSKSQLHYVISNEKNKIEITEDLYENGVQKRSFESLKVLLDYDGSDTFVIRERLQKYQILERAMGMGCCQLFRKIHYSLICRIISHEAFSLNMYNTEKLAKEIEKINSLDMRQSLNAILIKQ